MRRDAVKGAGVVDQRVGDVQIGPELDQEKGVLWALVIEIFESAFAGGEFVTDLSEVDVFQQRVRVTCVHSADLDEEVAVRVRPRVQERGELHQAQLAARYAPSLPLDVVVIVVVVVIGVVTVVGIEGQAGRRFDVRVPAQRRLPVEVRGD